jgi:Domain of unknown function (DUF4260)
MMSAPEIPSAFGQVPAATGSRPGSVAGSIRLLLRFEGAAVFAAAVVFYGYGGYSWVLFAVLFLAPDITMLAYLAGPRAGSAAYNAVHTYVPALALLLAGFIAGLRQPPQAR